MPDVAIRSGPVRVVASGTVTAFRDHPVDVTFTLGDERARVIVVFEEDPDVEAPTVDTEVVDDDTIRFTLVNFKNPLGTGTPDPVEIGSLEGKPLWFHFRVYDVEGGDPTLGYTFYLEDDDE